ncbi:MAG: hypothetical protein IPJ07_20170 [Acidobacteria bacterium]|nr:hypothetical protein [Acidobacteriota bacterium]
MIPIHALKQLEDALAESYGWGNNPFVREKITLAVTSKADRLGIAPEEYCRIAASSQSELLALVEETASSQSCFFREPEQFELLRSRIIPQLLNSLPGNEKLKIWSSVCATGEEAYSLAIVFDQIKRASPQTMPAARSKSLLQMSATGRCLKPVGHAMERTPSEPSMPICSIVTSSSRLSIQIPAMSRVTLSLAISERM